MPTLAASTNAYDSDGVAAGGTLDVAVPAGGASGDKYVLVSMGQATGFTPAQVTSPGFALVTGGTVDDTAFFGHTIYVLERDHDGTEGANFTVTQPTDATDRWGLVCLLLTDVGDQDSGMEVATEASSATIDLPAETTTEDDCLAIAVVSAGEFGTITGTPANFSPVTGNPFADDFLGVYTYTQATAGATPADTISLTGGASIAAGVVAFRSGGGGGTPIANGTGAVVTGHAGEGSGTGTGPSTPTYQDGFPTFLASWSPHTAVSMDNDTATNEGTDTDWPGLASPAYSTATGYPQAGLSNSPAAFSGGADFDNLTLVDVCLMLYVPSGLTADTTYGLFSNGGGTNGQAGWIRNDSTRGLEVCISHNASGSDQDETYYQLPADDRWYALGFQFEDNAGGMALWVDGVEVATVSRSFALAFGGGNPFIGNSNADEPTLWAGGNTGISGSGLIIANLVGDNPNATNSSPAGNGDTFHEDYATAHIVAGVTPAAGVGAVVTGHAGEASGSTTPVGSAVGAVVTGHAGEAAGSSTAVAAGVGAVVTVHAGAGSGSSAAVGAGASSVVTVHAGQGAGSTSPVGSAVGAVVDLVAGVGSASSAAQASGVAAIVDLVAGVGAGSAVGQGAGVGAVVAAVAGQGAASSAAQASGVAAVVTVHAGEAAGSAVAVGSGVGAVVGVVAGEGVGAAAGQALGVAAVVAAVAGEAVGSSAAVGAGVAAAVAVVAGEGDATTTAQASGVAAVVVAAAGSGAGVAAAVGSGVAAVVVVAAGEASGTSGAVAEGVPAVVAAVAGIGDGSAVPVAVGVGAVVTPVAGQGGGSASAMGTGRPAMIDAVAGIGSGIGAVLILQVAAAAVARRTSATVGARTSATPRQRTSATGRRGP